MKNSFASTTQFISDYKKLHITAKIPTHEVNSENSILGNKFVVYVVHITTHYKNWIVKKRYSDFENLHQRLLSKSLINLEVVVFPPKRIFKNSETTIIERKEGFEAYLNFLFKNVNICSHEEILEFIDIDKELLTLLMKNHTMIESGTSAAMRIYYSMKKGSFADTMGKKSRSVGNFGLKTENYYNSFLDYKLQDKNLGEKSANMMVVEEFLRNLEYKFENKAEIIKTFEQFLKSKKSWPSFRKEEISKLFYGDVIQMGGLSNSLSSDNSNNSRNFVKGLFYHIGNIEQNNFGAEHCLEFLGKLIDYEFNPECEAYIYMLKTSKIEYLHYLRLNEHIKSKKNFIVIICFRILKAILNEDKSIQVKLKRLIDDEDVSDKFLNWLDNNI